MVYSTKIVDGEAALFCNLSSWYVDPAFRNYAALFASMSQKRKDVTYFNVTPATATWPVIEAQGFQALLPRPAFFGAGFVTKRARHDRSKRSHPIRSSLRGCPVTTLNCSSVTPTMAASASSVTLTEVRFPLFFSRCENAGA